MDFFLLNLGFLLMSIMFYPVFRCGVYAYCRLSKMSKTFIRKNRKGIVNYWTYRRLHRQCGLGGFYYINILFLLSLALFMLCLLFSWIAWMRLPVIISAVILGVVQIPALIKAMIWNNRDAFGQAFVVFRVHDSVYGRPRVSTFLDWLTCLFPLGFYVIVLIRVPFFD